MKPIRTLKYEGRVFTKHDVLRPVRNWHNKTKVLMVVAINHRLVKPSELIETHGLSREELAEWRRRYAVYGVVGERSICNRIGNYRNPVDRPFGCPPDPEPAIPAKARSRP